MPSIHSRLVLAAAVAAVGLGSAFSYAGDDEDCCATSSQAGAALLISAEASQDQSATADELLAKFKAVEMPKFDQTKREDQAYIQEYMKLQTEALKERAAIGRQFIMSYLDHEQAPAIAQQTIQVQMYNLREPAQAREDIKTLLAKDNLSPELAKVLKIMDVTAGMVVNAGDTEGAWQAVQALQKEYPTDDQVAGLMARVAESSKGEARVQRLKQTLATFPDSKALKYTAGKLRQIEELGKPFEISFTDALTGNQVTSEDLKGKVVVIDFWATWCGPCIAEIPHMKELYSQYKDKGVEFVGISLDQAEEAGGKDALLKYCKENELAWPQYYQGAFWDGEFSTAWGINSIPAIFILDAEGNLHSTEARGKLDTLIPELIAKRDGADPRTAGAQ